MLEMRVNKFILFFSFTLVLSQIANGGDAFAANDKALAEMQAHHGSEPEPDFFRVLREILPRILSPLSEGYGRETLVVKGQLPTKVQENLADSLDPSPCRLRRREINLLLGATRPINRKISFTDSCPIDGQVSLEGDQFRRIDFTLKDLSPYFRFEARVRLRKSTASTPKVIGLELTIADGKIYKADQPYIPEVEFSGSYAMALDNSLVLMDPGRGEIFLAKQKEKKVDRTYPIVLTRTKVP